jgi:ankyrin repeat protein
MARLLLERGADPNSSEAGYAPLHWAVGAWETSLTGNFGIESSLSGLHGPQKLELVNLLLDYGADPNRRAAKNPPRFGFNLFRLKLAGATPFFLAAMAADTTIMRVLLSRGADPTLIADDHTTPLMVAAGIGRVVGETRVTEAAALEAVKLLMDLGADINAASDAGETALFGPAYTGADTILEALVAKGAAVNVKNKSGQTALDIAQGDTFASGAVLVHKSTAARLIALGATSKTTSGP